MAERCNCAKWVAVRTAWTDANSGRRFAGCPDFGCNYFRWVDVPLCPRARTIILGLIQRINVLEGEIKALEEKNEKKNMEKNKTCSTSVLLLLATWVIICLYLISNKAGQEM